ncbi:hypothetical protein FKB34_09435 [Glycocaulis profundi]|nr:hypothetical protein FKB34_09435 [Glycocaulis profundi]
MMRTCLFTITVTALGLALHGCDEAGGSGTRLDGGAAERLMDGVAAGESILTFEGEATADGAYTTADDARYGGESHDIYRPVQSGDRAGMNDTGPYMISVFADARHQDDLGNTVRAWITVSLPEGAGPGTYAAASPSDAEDGDAVVTLAGDGYGWRYQREVEGHVHVLEIGETITAAWEFDARRTRGEPGVTARGGVRDLAFSPQSEAEFTFTANGESEDFARRIGSQVREGRPITLVMFRDLYIEIPEDPASGTYRVAGRGDRSADVTLNLPAHSVDEVRGEMVLEREGDRVSGTFDIEADGRDTVRTQGRFVLQNVVSG